MLTRRLISIGAGLAAVLVCVAFHAAGAQAAGPPKPHPAMHALDFLLGEWEGDGWILVGRGERRTFHEKETVRIGAGGGVVVIDGLGTSTDAGRAGEVIHQAFAVVSYDSTAARFRWRAYRGGEEISDAPIVGGDSLVWGMDAGPAANGMRLRFTIRRTPEGEWSETGEMIPPQPAAPAYQFFAMQLRRRAAHPGGRFRAHAPSAPASCVNSLGRRGEASSSACRTPSALLSVP